MIHDNALIHKSLITFSDSRQSQLNLTADIFPQTWKWTCAIFQFASQPL